jgi:hypothetical protein
MGEPQAGWEEAKKMLGRDKWVGKKGILGTT